MKPVNLNPDRDYVDRNWELVKSLAACGDPMHSDRDGVCALCGEMESAVYKGADAHLDSCPWVTARRLTAETEEFRRAYAPARDEASTA